MRKFLKCLVYGAGATGVVGMGYHACLQCQQSCHQPSPSSRKCPVMKFFPPSNPPPAVPPADGGLSEGGFRTYF